jgi:predicted DNA binding CopG/RHH family protein
MNEQTNEELKTRRITVRISGSDLECLQEEATRRNTTLGAVVRDLIRATKANSANGNGHGNGHSSG